MNKPSLLFVEEVESSLSRNVISSTSVDVVILRFKQSMGFKAVYLEETRDIPSFIFDKENSIKTEVERFHNFCLDRKLKIEYFYNDSEYNQEVIQKFASLLGLKNTLTEYQSQCVRDKVIMKNFLNEIGLKTMAYQELESIQDAVDFAETYSFPIIVKWRKGLSSKEVYKVHNKQELEGLNLVYAGRRFMAEAFCTDLIWCIDALVQEGKVLTIFLAWLPYTNLSFAVHKEKFAQITVSDTPTEIKFDCTKLIQLVIDNLGLKNGYIHLEAFVNTQGQPIICEFAWRTPGEHMLSNHSIAFGVDVYNMLIDIMVGRKIKLSNMKGKRCVGDMFLPLKEGVIKKISSYNEIRSLEGVVDGEVRYSTGDTVESKRQYTDNAGWIQIIGDTKDQVVERMLNVYSKFVIIANK